MIIILNAPPSSGKDTIGNLLELTGFTGYSFKQPMFDLAQAVLPEDSFEFFMRDYNDREQKEKPQDYLCGFTIREFMINISESWVKPLFGKSHFGKLAADNIGDDDTFITDGGFAEEVIPLLNKGKPVVICRLHRKGCSYKGDSRRFLIEEDFVQMPITKRPIFLDVEVIEGHPEVAANTILEKVYGQCI